MSGTVYLVDCDGIPVACRSQDDANAIVAAWNLDHAEAIAHPEAPDRAATVRAISSAEIEAGVADGTVLWDELPGYRQVWVACARYTRSGEVLWLNGPDARGTWQFETEYWSEVDAVTAAWLDDAEPTVQVRGLDEGAVREAFTSARADALARCGKKGDPA